MTPRTRYLVVGGICGLTWAAGFRGWLAQLRTNLVYFSFDLSWTTLAVALVPGLVAGVLLGWAAYRRSVGATGPRWPALSPVLFAAVLLDPGVRHGPAVDLTVSTAHGAWVCLFGFSFLALLALACVLPHPAARLDGHPWRLVALGALVGLAWACALREFMAEVAGNESGVDWGLTFGYILLPGLAIGALLGRAEHLRRQGRRAGWPYVGAPLLFVAVLVPGLMDIDSMLEDGIGGGAIGVPVIAMLGGYAVSRRGRLGGRVLAGLLFLTGFTIWLLVAQDVGGSSFALTTAHGVWISTLYESLLVVFALGASIPHLRTNADRPSAGTAGASRAPDRVLPLLPTAHRGP